MGDFQKGRDILSSKFCNFGRKLVYIYGMHALITKFEYKGIYEIFFYTQKLMKLGVVIYFFIYIFFLFLDRILKPVWYNQMGRNRSSFGLNVVFTMNDLFSLVEEVHYERKVALRIPLSETFFNPELIYKPGALDKEHRHTNIESLTEKKYQYRKKIVSK